MFVPPPSGCSILSSLSRLSAGECASPRQSAPLSCQCAVREACILRILSASWRGSDGLSGPHSALEAFIGILICRRDTQQGVVSTRAHARVPIWLRGRVASALTPTYVPWTYVCPLDVRPMDVRPMGGRWRSHIPSGACVTPCDYRAPASLRVPTGWVGRGPRASARKPCAPRFLERAPPHSCTPRRCSGM